MNLDSKAKAALALSISAALLAMTLLPAFAQDAPQYTSLNSQKTATLKASGLAVRRVDDKVVRVPFEMHLTVELGERREKGIVYVPVSVIEGTVEMEGKTYDIEQGKGGVLPGRQLLLLWCKGEGSEGEQMGFKLYARYFWMGNDLHVMRGRGGLRIGDTGYLILFRGKSSS